MMCLSREMSLKETEQTTHTQRCCTVFFIGINQHGAWGKAFAQSS